METSETLLGRPRPVSWRIIVLALVVSAGLSAVINRFVFPNGLLRPVAEATGFLINETLLVNLVGLAVVVGGILFGLGRLRPQDVGLVYTRLVPGMAYALAYWMLWQAVILVIGLVNTGSVQPNSAWGERQATVIGGALVAQVFGNALLEEILYRGFLLPQLYLKFKNFFTEHRRICIAGAVVVSAFIFALMHIPAVLNRGYSVPRYLAMHTIQGLIYALLYVYSRNLFFVIGMHAFGNWNMPFFEAGMDTGLVGFLLKVVLVVVWSLVLLVQRGRTPRRTGPPVA